MSTVADYVGRTVDVLAYAGQKPAGEVLLIPTLARTGTGGEICTGVQKLAQRWLVEFLTIRGSMPYLPTRGSDFMRQLRQGFLQSALDAEQAFILAAEQVKSNLVAEEEDNIPADEAYGSYDLLGLIVAKGFLELRIQLLSAAGTARTVILPISITNS